jgi:hypothetical protein
VVRTAVCGLIAALLLAAPAVAADKPAPGCAGLAFSDAAGDAQSNPTGLPGGEEKAPANMDVTGGFFLSDGTTGTANIRIANLDRKVPDSADGVVWYMLWQAGDETRYVGAELGSGGEVAFLYGTYDPDTGGYTHDGDTTGALFEGPDGIVQIAIPADYLKGTLASPYAEASELVSLGVIGSLANDDTAPDDQKGADYTPGPCPAAAPPPAAGPSGGAPAPEQPAASSGAPAGLTLHVAPRAGSARSANRRKRVTLAVRSDAPVTNLVARLLAANGKGRTLASGRRSRLDGAGALRLKTKRRLRRGRYVLRITATGPGGRATQSFPVVLTR